MVGLTPSQVQMLSWIPLIGPIIQGIVSIFTKKMDTDVQKLQINRSSDTDEAKVSAQIIHDTQDDIGLRLLRDVAITPVVVWSGLIGWDTIVAIRYPWLQFHVASYPDTVAYLPYAVIVFLFGNIGLNIWKRK